MKKQPAILMLSFTALALCSSIKATQHEFLVDTLNYHKTREFKDLELQDQLRLLEEADNRAEVAINNFFKPEDQFHDQLRSTLQQSLVNPLPYSINEHDPELQEALLLSLSSIPTEETPQQESKEQVGVEEDYPGMEKALAASLLDVKKERKQQKKSLIKNIVELHPQVVGLREDKRELEVQQSSAWDKYYPYKDLIDSEEKTEKEKLWKDLLQKDWKVSSKLNDTASGLNSMIEQYLSLISDQAPLKEVGKNPIDERWQEKKRLEERLRDVRLGIERLREELQKKKKELSEKRELYLLDRKGTWETLEMLGEEVSSIQLELDSAIAQESGRIAEYFTFVHKLGVPSGNSSDKF